MLGAVRGARTMSEQNDYDALLDEVSQALAQRVARSDAKARRAAGGAVLAKALDARHASALAHMAGTEPIDAETRHPARPAAPTMSVAEYERAAASITSELTALDEQIRQAAPTEAEVLDAKRKDARERIHTLLNAAMTAFQGGKITGADVRRIEARCNRIAAAMLL
jgi:hypothetical protein